MKGCKLLAAFSEYPNGVNGWGADTGMAAPTIDKLLARQHQVVPRALIERVADLWKDIAVRTGWTPASWPMTEPEYIEMEWRRLWKPWKQEA